jgi:hypothetical protein
MSGSPFLDQLQENVRNYVERTSGNGSRTLGVEDIIASSLARVKPASSNVVDTNVPGYPPTPTGFTVSAESSYIVVSHDQPIYTLGGGHSLTRVYGKLKVDSQIPVFADAEEIGQFTGYIWLMPASPNEIWHLWIKWEAINENISNTPAGGDNGLVATTSKVDAASIDTRGLDIKDDSGNTIFSPTGEISNQAFLNVNGNNILLSDIASGSLIPALSYVGDFATPPTEGTLGGDWRQNAVYKNPTDGKSYVLTGSPLAWVEYLVDGQSFYLTIESTNGTSFRVGQNINTTLKARLFKNGAEVTNETPESWFFWRRLSGIPQQPPNDDATWNALYAGGYKQVTINVDDVYARATFFCDIISNY